MNYVIHINVPVKIDSQRTIVIIDSGVSGNFISEVLVRLVGLLTRRKKDPYDLRIADGSTLLKGSVDEEITSLPFIIQRYYKEMSFDIIGIATYYIILGMP